MCHCGHIPVGQFQMAHWFLLPLGSQKINIKESIKLIKNEQMKTHYIKFRVSAFDRKRIQLRAKKAGLNVSDFLRSSALNKPLKKRLTREEEEGYLMLKKYANNFINISNMFRRGDQTRVKEIALETANLIKHHLKKFD